MRNLFNKYILFLALLVSFSVLGVFFRVQANSPEMRINTGGPAFTDPDGKVWQADAHFNTGNLHSTWEAISNTTNDKLYQTERFDQFWVAPDLEYAIPVTNGNQRVTLHFAEIYFTEPGKRIFDVKVEGTEVISNLDIYAEVGAKTALTKSFTTSVSDGTLNILFISNVESPKISGIEIIPQTTNHLAHAVAGDDQILVDIDNNGTEQVSLSGADSHTHAFNKKITKYVWTEGTTVLAQTMTPTLTLGIGTHTILLTVEDDGGNTSQDTVTVTVTAPTGTSNLTGYYYNFAGSPPSALPILDGKKPDFGQFESSLNSPSTTGAFRNTPYSDNFAARFHGLIKIDTAGTYGFAVSSDDGSKLSIDGKLLINNDGVHAMVRKSATTTLTAGYHEIIVDFFDKTGGAGLQLYWNPLLKGETLVPSSVLFHNHATVVPVINSLSSTSGPVAGGNKITIKGIGFVFPKDKTKIQFGILPVAPENITIIDDKTIEVLVPAGTGSVPVTVMTPNGVSNAKTYSFSNTALPAIKFTKGTLLSGINGPTSMTFGPDKKLYVATQFGEIWILTLDANYTVINTVKSFKIQESSSKNILGIAFNPLDDPQNPKLYVSHSQLFHGGNGKYSGKVSVLSGTNLSIRTEIISGLSVSDHDHGINSLAFDASGNLLIQAGGNTNAGIIDPALGNLPEAPLSAATLIAYITKPGFNGKVTYDTAGKQIGGDVQVYAAGFRNPFDLTMHSNGYLYGTDNGPNTGYGDKSTSCTTQTEDPYGKDELNIILKGNYYGHPNRFRGSTDARQCIYYGPDTPSTSTYTAPLTQFSSSTNGIMEYTANTFGGQLRKHLFTAKLSGNIYAIQLSADGKSVLSNKVLLTQAGLDLVEGRDGTIIISDNQNDMIVYYKSDEPTPTTPTALSVFPVRGPLTGNRTITITGVHFSSSTSVKLGGKDCPIKSVSTKEITCTVPAGTTAGAVDVVVTTGGASTTLNTGYTYMNGTAPSF